MFLGADSRRQTRIRKEIAFLIGVHPRLTLLREDLNQVEQCLRRLLQSAARVELQLTVEICAAREQVRRRQTTKRQVRSVRAAAYRFEKRLWARPPRRLHCAPP